MDFLKRNTRKLLLILFCFVGCVLCAIGIKQNVAAIHELRQEQTQTTVTQTTPIIVVVEPEQPTRAYFNIPLPYNVQDHIFDECDKYNVDPAIVVALINRESKFNDYAIGDDGRSFGLMQIQAKWHLQRMIKLNCTNLFDQYQNITVGIDYLAELYNQYGCDYGKALTAYNRGSYQGTVTSYAKDVLWNAKNIYGKVD